MFAKVGVVTAADVDVDAGVLGAARAGNDRAVSNTALQIQRHSNTDFPVTDVEHPARWSMGSASLKWTR